MRPIGPYIVIGTGRCGTSSVSRILHTKLDINMGDAFTTNETTNPGGTWEDVIFWNMHRHLINDKLSLRQWMEYTQHIVNQKTKANIPWGWKDPVTTTVLPFYLIFFDTLPRIIRCNRDKTLTLRSMKKNWKQSDEGALMKYTSATTCLDRILQYIDHLVIDFGKDKLSDGQIEAIIKSKWEDV